jgi:hypothetical protein
MSERQHERWRDYVQHKLNCAREIMRHADDSAKYLSEPCTCGLDALLRGELLEQERVIEPSILTPEEDEC